MVSVSPSASGVVSSKEEKKKKRKERESGDSFVNVYLRLRLTWLLLSAICCCRLCLIRVLLDARPFCFLQYTALPALCNYRLFFYLHFAWGVPLAPSLVELSSQQLQLQAFPSPGLLGGVRHSCLLWPACLFTVRLRDCPFPTLRSWGTLPSLLRVFFFFSCLFIIQFVFFLFFSPLGGSLCPGGYADLAQGCPWEYCMPLSSPGGLLLPSRIGAGIWWHRSPPGFSI
jgi:hypothetical protein